MITTFLAWQQAFTYTTVILLIICLTIATWSDIVSRRIPNKLVAIGVIASFLLNLTFQEGSLFSWLCGFLTGLGLFLPLYLVRTMGAGDVKLMAMVGSFLGPAAVVSVAIATLLAGGILAIISSLMNRNISHALNNAKLILLNSLLIRLSGGKFQVTKPANSAGDMPYAIAISAGAAIHLFLSLNGNPIFS